ncbi:hypothetical protein ACFXA3_02985 [Streptomyces sp. NPDC059456]|uniref:hypothetical protein n=1 Tax=Streptomyces sp. NPDC059456 TaxID=3346838 RepID=UPI0036AAD818
MGEGQLHRTVRPASSRFDDMGAGDHEPVSHQESHPGHGSVRPEDLDHGGEQV